MNNLTQEQIELIADTAQGNLTDFACRFITHWMIGYMKRASDMQRTKDDFYSEVVSHIRKNDNANSTIN